MSQSSIDKAIIVAVLTLACSISSVGQRRNRGHTRDQGTARTTSTQRREPLSGENNWWAAQRSIETAIQQLESYLRQSSNGERAETARQQILALRSLTITAALPEWATMDHEVPSRDVPEWRISSISRAVDRTTFTIEIRCKREDGEDCHFLSFQRHPLVLIDNAGRIYPMLEARPSSPEIRFTDTGKAILAGGRILPVIVDFAPLPAETVSVQVQYRDRNTADPARFSALRQK
jgi:hypothetical protein